MVPRARRHITTRMVVLGATLAVLMAGGCASNKISLRSIPKSPLINQLELASYNGPRASERSICAVRPT